MKSSAERHSGWPLIIGIIVGVLALTAGPALAALTFSGTSISGDTAVIIDSSSTISIGTSTATGITIGRSGQGVNFPGSLSTTNATTTNLAITALGTSGSNCLTVNAAGNVATTTCGGSSQWTTSGTAIYYNAGDVGIGITLPSGAPSGTLGASVIYSPNQAVNVKAYGAIGDGVHDDTAAVAAAIAASNSVYFPNGTYLVSSLSISGTVRLFGESQAGAIVKSSGSTSNFIAATASNIELDTLTIQATGSNGTALNFSSGLSGITLNSVLVKGAATNGVNMTSDSNVNVSQSTFSGNGSVQFNYTLTASTTASNLNLADNTFDGSGTTFVALFIQAAAGSSGSLTKVNLQGNTIIYPGRGSTETDGLVLISSLTNNGFSDVSVVGGSISGDGSPSTSGQALEIKGPANVSVSGVTVDSSNGGIAVQNGAGVTGYGSITGNTVRCSGCGSGTIGILLASNGKTIASGNTVQGNYSYGVFAQKPKQSVISNNIICGTNCSGVSIQATDTNVIGNTITEEPAGGGGIAISLQSNQSNELIGSNKILDFSYGIDAGATSYTNVQVFCNEISNTSPGYIDHYNTAGLSILDCSAGFNYNNSALQFAQDAVTAPDVGLSRGAANKLYVGNGSAGNFTGTLIAGNVGIGTTAPSTTLQIASASSTIRIGTASLPGCIEVGNSDGSAGINYVTFLNGAMTATTTKPSACQ